MSNILGKNAQGYGYKYTDIAEITKALEDAGTTYWQYVEPIGDYDYIYTVPIICGVEYPPRRGCRIVSSPFDKKSNPAQEQGAAITYARRYSLLMAFGLATTDDDAECLTRTEKPVELQKIGPTKVTSLKTKCKEDKVDENTILKKYNITDLSDLNEKQFAWICHNWSREFVNGDKG